MSKKRRLSRPPVAKVAAVLILVGGGLSVAWMTGRLPAGMQVTANHIVAALRSRPKPAPPAPVEPSGEEQALTAAAALRMPDEEVAAAPVGEQFEPPLAAPSEPPADSNEDGPHQDPLPPLEDPLSPAGRRRVAERANTRQLSAVAGDDPFAETVKANSGATVTTAGFEELADQTDIAANPRTATSRASSKAKTPTRNTATANSPVREKVLDPTETSPAPAAKAKPKSSLSKIAAPAQSVQGAGLTDLFTIEKLIESGDFPTAQRELSRWYWKVPEKREEIRKQLEHMAESLYFSPTPLFHEPYVIQPGDQLRVIAQRYKISWEYLATLNHVDARKIRMGQKLKVVEGPFSVIVSLSSYELIVHLNGSYVKRYRVGVGKEGSTPVGTFVVKNKMVDPTYYGPDGLVMAHDDPQNPLGERWIDIGDSYGIHGTIDPDSIGKNESRGCVRMLNKDVEEVYDFLVLGSQVKIQK